MEQSDSEYSLPALVHNALMSTMLQERTLQWINNDGSKPPKNIKQLTIDRACAEITAKTDRITNVKQILGMHGVGSFLSSKVIPLVDNPITFAWHCLLYISEADFIGA
jgi:hypothetical protein